MNNRIYYDSLLSVFLKRTPNDYIYQRYFNYYKTDETYDDNGFLVMQEFISKNLKKELNWLTAISVLESIESMIKDSASNGNISLSK